MCASRSRARRKDSAGEETLNVLCRGLVGYVSYLAACRGYPVYSEYALYEPVLRIGHAQGYRVDCEVPIIEKSAAGERKRTAGDHPRIDFDFYRPGADGNRFGLEVKWTNVRSPKVTKDVDKLKRHAAQRADATGYLLVFGPYGVVNELKADGLESSFRRSKLIGWSAGKTKYGARWFRVA